MSMENKTYLLFDADNTLYDFTATEKAALSRIFSKYNIPESLLPVYHQGNRKCWEMYEKGEMTLDTLENERFRIFLREIGRNEDPDTVGEEYSRFLGEEGIMIDGAVRLLENLKDRYTLCLITNGIANIQRERIRRTDTARFFHRIFISHEIGYAKPDKRFFDYVLSSLNAAASSCLVIGDSLTSDIQGALNAGIDSVYLSFDGNKSDKATWSVSSYDELLKLLDA